MHITVKQFTIVLVLSLLFITYFVFGVYFYKQQERTAAVILKTIKNDLYSLSYTLSKDLVNKTKEEIPSIRPILDRTAIDNDFIETILMMKDDIVLITTDPFYDKKIIRNTDYFDGASQYDELITKSYYKENISFYQGNKKYIYKLVFLVDKNEISTYFSEHSINSFIYLALLPIIIVLLLFVLLKYFLTNPLEKLRQFAYYHNDIPSAFRLRELEAIRYSMIQTFARLEKEKNDLYIMSRTDELSGLANRNSLQEYLEHLIQSAKRNDLEFAFLFLDLDDFKSVNDSLGHDIGDEVLKSIASIIKNVIRTNDLVARIGGDEFIIILQDYSNLLELTNIIQRIQNALSKKMLVLSHPINVQSSIGVALYPDNGMDMLALMKHSDIAMYEAKKNGKSQYHFFTDALNERVQNTIKLDADMRTALLNDEYQLYYQPKVDLISGKVLGVEALIRWNHPVNGFISPDKFIPLAEGNGFIIELGDWILQEAIKQSKAWSEAGIDLTVSINVSTKQLLENNFVSKLYLLLDTFEVNPKQIDIEITEYLFLESNENNFKILYELHDRGITVSLDDFGTGYSSLTYLKKFPIDCLKIDKAFMDDYHSKDGAIFIETIVKMGQNLNLSIVAEGIESLEQVEYLKSIGCNQYQGYYYSKALPADELKLLI